MTANGRTGSTDDRLDSWKEIAAYLKRSVRTVTRWEREEGLPVHRHIHTRSGSVYAFKAELDAWWTSRRESLEPSSSDAESTALGGRRWIVLFAVTLATVSAVIFYSARHPVAPTQKLMPLTTYPGSEGPPSLSPDGNQVTFERDGDIFVKQVDGEALARLTNTPQHEFAPAWSPDGRQIAFTREGDGIFVIAPLGGAERRVASTRVPLLLKTISWTADAASLVVSQMTSSVCASLFVVSIGTGEQIRLTSPPEPSIGDGWPSVSPDGKTVAFARYTQDTSANVYVVSIAGGEPRKLTTRGTAVFGLAWNTDAELIVSSDRTGASRLWRLPVNRTAADFVGPVDVAGEDARFPALSRSAGARPVRLAYQRFAENLDIRRAEIIGDDTAGQPTMKASQPFIVSTRSEDHPQYSPDGSRIAFVSRRSGASEIWICESDGSNPVRLTSMDGPLVVAPRWSPDGRRLAFFAATGAGGNYAVYVIRADGGPPSRLTRTERELEALPAWSRDGRSIYLTAGRSGSLQLWRMPTAGGEPMQLTRNGGAEAAETPDGRTIYYTKVPESGPGLWSIPSTGGEEIQVLEHVRFGYWAISSNGIYFIDFDVARGEPRPVRFFAFRSRQSVQVGTVERSVMWTNAPGFAVSPDGRWLLFSSLESTDADLMLVDNFR